MSDQPKLDGILRDMLIEERRRIAEKCDIRSFYYICHDISIDEMATFKPQTLEDIKKIKGIKSIKADQYGNKFLGVISKRPTISYTRIYSLDEAIKLHNSACTFYLVSDVDKAIEYMKLALESKRQLLGPTHSSTRLSEDVFNEWTSKITRS